MTLTRITLFFIIFILLIQPIPLIRSVPMESRLTSWTKATISQGHYVNIHQIATQYGDGISVDTLGYPGAYEYLYTFFAYYNQMFTVPKTGTIEIRGYFYYNDTSYITNPTRKYIAAYLITPDLTTIIATTHILDYDNGEQPGIWYYKRVTITTLTPGQSYYFALGRYDHFSYERYLQASWAAVDVAPPHLIKVPQTFATIQEALTNATDGDIIQVANGIYHENLIIDKGINLIGENGANTIIDAPQSGAAIFITANNATIKGFTIRSSSQAFGFLLTDSLDTKITQNIITTNQNGISLQNSNNTQITNNKITNSTIGIQITLNSNNNTIYHNNFINNTQQIQIDLASNNTWDNGFEEGNYWSDYTGTDANHDGIGDTMLPWQTVDSYPLLKPYVEGDVNHDGTVNIIDATLLALAWQTTQGQPKYNIHADFNTDKIVNIIDVTIMGANWQKRYN